MYDENDGRTWLTLGNGTNVFAPYDETIAKSFASLASTTYCVETEQVLNWTCTSCEESKTRLVPGKIKIIDGSEGNSVRVLVGKLRDQPGCLMAFRGSENVLNWITDFKAWEVSPTDFSESCDGCKVHSGFYATWNDIRDLVLDALEEVGCSHDDPKDNHLYITGHSMGAALTHIAMFALNDGGWTIAKTYSYEAPRVGNDAFARAFNSTFSRRFSVFRITHHKDPVVHVPPEVMGYQHVDTEIYYDEKGEYKVCDGTGEDGACADQFWDVPAMVIANSGDHCASPLVPNGSICDPEGCGK